MDNLIILFWTIILTPFLLWTLWTLWTYRKRRMNLFAFQMVVLGLGIFYTTWKLEIFPGSTWYYERKSNKELTGLSFSTDKLLYCHKSERSFNGDGYSISVYSLDEKTAKSFQNPEIIFFENFPIKSDPRKKWQNKHWGKSPIKDDEKIYLDFALNEFNPHNKSEAQKLSDTFSYILKIMNQPGVYYAYNFNGKGTFVGDIDFFIISPTDKKLIIINHNT